MPFRFWKVDLLGCGWCGLVLFEVLGLVGGVLWLMTIVFEWLWCVIRFLVSFSFWVCSAVL